MRSKAQTGSHEDNTHRQTQTHTHTLTLTVGHDSCHSHQPPVRLSSLLDNSQAFLCQTTYVTAFWQHPLPEPVAGSDSRPLLLVALRTWSLMSLRQLTDAVTAPRYNTSHWQTRCDKDIQAHQCVHRHTDAQSHKYSCLVDVRDNSCCKYNLYSVLILSSAR